MSKQRLRYIDLGKGIAMLLVITGHCTYISPEIKALIYSFHMPLFFALSGMTFNTDRYTSLRELIKNKFRTLIVPYFFLTFTLWLLQFSVLNKFSFSKENLSSLIGIVISWRMSSFYGTMWFVPALFCAEIPLYLILKKYRKKNVALSVIAIGSYILGIIICHFVKGFAWSLDLVPLNLSFLIFGYLISQSNLLNIPSGKSTVAILCSSILTIVAAYVNYTLHGHFEIFASFVGNPALFFLSSCLGTYAVIAFCKRINHCNCIEFIGRNTIIFYAYQKRITLPIIHDLLRVANKSLPFVEEPIIATVVSVVGSCIMLTIASYLINRYIPFVMGKKQAV